MAQTNVTQEAVGFAISSLIELWSLDGTTVGLDTIYHFCNGSSANWQPIVYDGITYTPFPIKIESMDVDGKGTLPRPKLTVSNINGFVSNLLLRNTSIDGATVIRTRVFARFLDAANFPPGPLPSWVTPDTTAHYAPEPWQINRKITENPQVVQFELASPLEAQRAKLPKRQIIANACTWKYRQTGTCNYSGAPVSDAANRSFTGSFYNMTLTNQGNYDESTTYNRGDYVTTYSTLPQFSSIPFVWVCTTNGTVGANPSASSTRWVADACAKTVAACSPRFTDTPLRTSAYPGVARAGWIARGA